MSKTTSAFARCLSKPSRLGYGVVEASSPLQALRLLDEDQQVTLLFTDVVMPDMSGRQLADRMREKRPKLKVLI